ncbi:MAG: hypothetical protein ACYTGC_15435 [Planctomycetota bacterium]|jgi:glucose uptake protein GlcU
MSQTPSDPVLAAPGSMIFSALLFGFFGFLWGYPLLTPTNQIIPMVATLMWTVRGTAITFLAAGLLAMAAPRPGNLLYSVAGLVSSGLFVVVAVWDLNSPLVSGIPWYLLLLFAVWNGYGAWAGLKPLLVTRGRETFGP